MDKKRILFIIDSLGCGGAEKSLVSLLPLLDFSQLDVCLSIVRSGGVFEQYVPKEVQLLPFPEPGRMGMLLYKCLFSALRRILLFLGRQRHGAETGWVCRRWLQPAFDGRFDIAIAYQQGFPTYFVADKVQAGRKIAWINTDMEKAGYRASFNRPFYDRMSKVCVVSEALSEALPQAGFVGKEKISLVKDIINANLIKQMSKWPVQTTGETRRVTLLTVGRMAPPKNYPLAVDTARILKDKGAHYRWLFVGDGPEKAKVERMVQECGLEENIVLLGMQPNPYPYYAICDIYVQTSSFEGFGITLSEAKIFHKPVVTTCFPSAYDQIVDGENGLIAGMTAGSLAEKILSVIENQSLREHLVKGTQNEENRTAETESAKVNSLLWEI